MEFNPKRTNRPMRQISCDEIKSTLEALGYVLRDCGKSWSTSAVYRNGDNSNALSIFKDSGVWTDFVTNEVAQPFSRLVELSGGLAVKVNGEPSVVKNNEVQVERVYPASMLDKLAPNHQFYLSRGVDVPTLQRLRGGLAMSGQMYQRYIFPIINSDGNIIGFSGRDLCPIPNQSRPKWKHVGVRNKWVYPLHVKDEAGEQFVRQSILASKTVIVVESIGDLLAFHTNKTFNVLVSFGLKLSSSIVCALIELGVERVILAPNNDSEKPTNYGLNSAINNLLLLLPHFDLENVGVCLPTKKDFGEMSPSDFEAWGKKVSSVDYEYQRTYICEHLDDLLKSKAISKAAWQNGKYLNCS